jgi:HEAT repeat protein
MLPTVAAPGRGIGEPEQGLAKAIQAYGKAAIPRLLALLEDERPDTKKLAAYTLRDISGLSDADVPPLLKALAAGEQWVAPALGRIGSPTALEGLFKELEFHPGAENQVAYAFKLAERKSVPILLKPFDCAKDCNRELLGAVASILGELGPDAIGAVARLTDVATDEHRPMPARCSAIEALGNIGESAVSAAPALERLARKVPRVFGGAVQEALMGMKSPAAVKPLVAKLRREPDANVLQEIAQLGLSGKGAGPSTVPLLKSGKWDVRVAAARALGYIGYIEGAPALIAALKSEEDWQLVFASAESLGRMRVASAADPLQAIALRHWYPPVREAARKASEVIAGREAYVSRWHPDNFSFEFFDVEHAGRDVAPCVAPSDERPSFLPDADLQRALTLSVAYDAVVVGYGAGPGGRPERHEFPKKQTPSAALQVEDGWLLGGSRGEWGGELIHTDSRGRQIMVLDDNIHGLARLGRRVVALGGLAHLSMNAGVVYEAARDTHGRWAARPWRVLPGAPFGSEMQADGHWLIHANGGSVLLSPDGTLAMAKCEASAETPPHRARPEKTNGDVFFP